MNPRLMIIKQIYNSKILIMKQRDYQRQKKIKRIKIFPKKKVQIMHRKI